MPAVVIIKYVLKAMNVKSNELHIKLKITDVSKCVLTREENQTKKIKKITRGRHTYETRIGCRLGLLLHCIYQLGLKKTSP